MDGWSFPSTWDCENHLWVAATPGKRESLEGKVLGTGPIGKNLQTSGVERLGGRSIDSISIDGARSAVGNRSIRLLAKE